MRGSATLFAALAMALAAIGLAFAAPGRGEDRALLELQNASGAVRISNSRAGLALFSASAMRPGEGISGTVRIGNDGDVAGRFSVLASGVQDTPGATGGLLSQRVDLMLLDVTDVQQPVTVFAGHPADFRAVALGTLRAREKRDYLFAATLPDGGAADNRYQGAGLTVGFEWRATAAATATPTPTPAPPKPPIVTPPKKPAAPTKPKVTAPPLDLADALGLPPATTCARRDKLTIRLKAPGGAKVVSAKIAVNGRTKLRLEGAKVRRPVTVRRLRRRAKVTVTLRASNGRVHKATRIYRRCRR